MRKLIRLLASVCLLFTVFSCNSAMEDEILEQKQTSSSKQTEKTPIYTYDVLSLHRFVKNSRHFYTTNYAEGIANGYQYEGVLGLLYFPKAEFYPITTPETFLGGPALLRWRHKTTGDRILTAGSGELLAKLYTNSYPFPNGVTYPGSSNGEWVYEGILGYVSSEHVSPYTTAVYRYYKSSNYDHLFTNNINELGGGGLGYANEGYSFALYKN